MFPSIAQAESLPFHPAVVHLPLALAMLVPLFALGVLWAIRSGKVPATAWVLVVGLQALLVGGVVVALRTGEQEDTRLEGVVEGTRLEAHRAAAQQFAVAGGLGLALAVGGWMAGRRGRPRARALATRGTVVMSLVVAGLALRAGYRGEELVYGAGGLGGAEVAGDRDSDEDEDPDDDQDDARESFRERMERDREDDEDARDRAVARLRVDRRDEDTDCARGDRDDDDDDDD